MRKLTYILLTMCFTAFAFTSCLKTDETETAPECAITAYSVGDIKTDVTVHRSSGVDTVITKTISGSNIHFNIDQVNGIITTVDSLPNWVSLKKVCPTFTCDGYLFLMTDGDTAAYKATSGSDSINFEKPIKAFSMSTDQRSIKNYTITIKRSAYSVDTLVWTKHTNNCPLKNDFRTIEYGNRVFAFFKNNAGKTMVTVAAFEDNLATWTSPTEITGTDIDYTSVVLFQDNMYALSTDGCICKIDNYTATKVSDMVFKTLLAADDYYIYATDGKEILGSEDLTTWTSYGSDDMDMLPSSCINYFSYTSKSNSDMKTSMMNGLSDGNSDYAVAWYKITSKNTDTNQKWMYIQITDENSYGLPKFKDMSTTMYSGSLYAIGIEPDTNPDTYQYLYRSDDNGITWHNLGDSYPMPTDLDATKGTAKLVSTDDNLWIIQKGGNVWSGVIR